MNFIAHTPFIKTPLSDFGTIFGSITAQTHGTPQCKRFELKYLDCMDAYGLEKGYLKCTDAFEDFYECARCIKQEWRYQQLKAERMKKIKEGKLEKNYVEAPGPEVMYPIYI